MNSPHVLDEIRRTVDAVTTTIRTKIARWFLFQAMNLMPLGDEKARYTNFYWNERDIREDL